MAAKVVPLNKNAHKDLRVKLNNHFPLAEGQQMIPLIVHEIPHAANDFPVIFVKDNQTDDLRVAALCGVKPGENLFVNGESWGANYVPFILRNYPLSLASSPEDKDRLVLCIDVESNHVSKEEGEPLFKDDGEQSDFLAARFNALKESVQHSEITNQFVKTLKEFDLFVEQGANFEVGEEKPVRLTGFYVVDEKKLNELDDEKFGILRSRGLLPAIYCHLGSLSQIFRLSKLKFEANQK